MCSRNQIKLFPKYNQDKVINIIFIHFFLYIYKNRYYYSTVRRKNEAQIIYWENINKLNANNANCEGFMCSYGKGSGHCLAAYFNDNGSSFIIIDLGCTNYSFIIQIKNFYLLLLKKVLLQIKSTENAKSCIIILKKIIGLY